MRRWLLVLVPVVALTGGAVAIASRAHDEPPTVNRLAGLGIGYLGVIVLVSRSLGASGSTLTGELALVLSTISYGAGAVYAPFPELENLTR